jgi:arylsulfatase
VAKGSGGPWELYDMKRDRTEMNDLANRQPAKVREMVALWDRWAERTHAVPWPWKPAYGTEATGSAPAK